MSKRILSLVLALVMVLGTFGTVFAETAETTLDSKVQWLIDQGLLQGDGSGDYGLEKTVTRDVLARIVAVALQDEESAKALQSLPSGFVDMTSSHWANGYASYANAKGYMVGNAKRQFMPAGTTTYAEALVVLTKIALNGDLTEAEKANALTWYAPYVAKANEIGVTEGVTIANVGAPAVKEDILKMLYNVLNSSKFGNYNVIKAIVLENDRIARVGANEVTVEVIKEVQRANFVDASREDLRGEQYTYELPAKFNAEDLLGKVVDLSIDKNNKVVEVKVDSSYEVLTGAVSGITSSRLTINKKQYIVNLDEKYKDTDERVFRTYLNDKDLKYVDFAKDNETVEYARITVKSGKVLFIDAYNFDDIMPVKEVKEVRGKDHVISYDDVRNGNLIETEVTTARVILVNDKTFTRGTLEDVKADNVIHTYKVGTSTKYVVLQDKAIAGKLDKITEDKDGDYIVVDGTSYTIPTKSPKEAVYEFESDSKFYTLTAKDAYKELDSFRGESVKVLVGLDGKVQFVGSDVGFGEFAGVATRVVGKEMRVLNPDNKLNDYVGNLDTDVYVAGTKTAHQGLNRIDENSLVYVNTDGETLVTVRDYDDKDEVTKLTDREINGLRITDDTVVYVVNSKGKAEVRKIADVVKAYKKLVEKDEENNTTKADDVRVSLIDEKEFDRISVRGYKFARADHVYTMVLYDLDIAPSQKDAIYGKLIRYTDRKASGKSTILIELSDGTERTFTIDGSVDESKVDFTKGSIYSVVESKETEDLALSVDKVIFNGYGEVSRIENYAYEIKGVDGTLYETRSTDIFGRRPRKGDKISYLLDSDYEDDMIVIVNPGIADDSEVEGDLVTYINSTGTRIEVNGTTYKTDDDTKLYAANGRTIVAIGSKDIKAEIVANETRVEKITTDRNDDRLIVSFQLVEDKEEPKPEVDKAALTAALDKADAKVEADYTAESWTAFEEALEAAKALPEAIQAEVDAKVAAVNAAIAKLVEKEEEPEENVAWATAPSVLFTKLSGKLTIPASLEGKVVVKANGTEIELNADGSFEVYDVSDLQVKVTVEVDGVEDTTLAKSLLNI
ncbi:S-layer homology domain-containing protein [Tissierella carlieri]|uniref:FIVAR domain-containing protein n=1 Tax=Tissierella carlieri TaxID=689904 RepID=UPI001C124204|nr:FIVAR domain-containing protein [Tissierella carlieri]MBU5313139.1 S-layer homology domain-containing protein [Tissierella carlieri]